MAEQWCIQKLEKLKIKEDRNDALAEIRVHLHESPNLESTVAQRLLDAPELYECLDDSEHFDTANDILTVCMANLSLTDNQLPTLLQRSLSTKRSTVRAMILNELLKKMYESPDIIQKASKDFYDYVLSLLEDQDSSVGVPAVCVLSIAIPVAVNQKEIFEKLEPLLEKDEIIKCRVYELAVKLSKISLELHDKVIFILEHAVKQLESRDILLQVNILELFAKLSEQNHGLAFLELHKVFEIVSDRVKKFDENPMDRLLVPGLMKFFGKIAAVQPHKIIRGYPHMIQCLFEAIYSGDPSLLPAAFDTFANLASSTEGKVLLNNLYEDGLRMVFEAYASHLRNLSSDLKCLVFNTLEVIFTLNDKYADDNEIMLQQWYSHLEGENGTDMHFLMDYCRSPFPDIKIACLNFIRTLCRFDWGISALKNTAGLIEYLLDRRTEFDHKAKYAKYDLIKVLGESVLFDVQTHIMLQTYINEGPFYIERATEVATEGD